MILLVYRKWQNSEQCEVVQLDTSDLQTACEHANDLVVSDPLVISRVVVCGEMMLVTPSITSFTRVFNSGDH